MLVRGEGEQVAVLKRLAEYVKPHWRRAALMILGLLAFMALEMLQPLILRETIDKAIPAGSLKLVLALAGCYVLIAVVRGMFSYLQWWNSDLLGQLVTMDLQIALHDHLQNLHDEYFRKQKTGDIMSRVTGDVESLLSLMGWGAMLFAQNVFTIGGAMLMLLLLNAKLTLVSLAVFPLMFLIVIRYDKIVRPMWKQAREQMAHLTTVLQENISGVRTVKAFAREEHEVGKFDQKNAAFFATNVGRVAVESNTLPLIDFVSGLSSIILLWYGGRAVIHGELTLGTLIAFQSYIWKVIWPIRSMGWLINLLEQALAAAPRLFEILDTPSQIFDRPDAVPAPRLQGRVEFRDVEFTFDDGTSPVLKDISLTIEPGQVVAILGGTGSGKSTLVHLLPRFFDPTRGAVLIDEIDIRDFTLQSLRQQIGVVLQDTFLFSASIRDNIAYGRPDAPLEEVVRAAKLAEAHEFISKLEQGYDTPIGERGVGLSGGQKQRIALARAILMDPAILILDEATSSVDSQTEDLIQAALDEVMRGRTTFIIAKRLSTIKRADLVLILDGGEVIEAGPPEELLSQSGVFRRIYDAQMGNPEAVASGR
jgi:ATP-binding cassette subfamily B multidrug efflux pump